MIAPDESCRLMLLESVRVLLMYVPAGTTTVPPPAFFALVIAAFRFAVSVVAFPVAAATVKVLAGIVGKTGSAAAASGIAPITAAARK